MKDGGPAFPVFPSSTTYAVEGMSLRDWFAGMALGRYYCGSQDPGYIAREVYRIADAMLAERDKEARRGR